MRNKFAKRVRRNMLRDGVEFISERKLDIADKENRYEVVLMSHGIKLTITGNDRLDTMHRALRGHLIVGAFKRSQEPRH